MTTTQLIADLSRLGIRLEAHGDRLRYSPRSAVTPDLTNRIKSHKTELMLMLQRDAPDNETIDPFADWIECEDPDGRMTLIRPDLVGNVLEAIDPPDECSECGSLWLWQSVLGNWYCQRCNPPEPADRLIELAKRLRASARNRARRSVGSRYGV